MVGIGDVLPDTKTRVFFIFSVLSLTEILLKKENVRLAPDSLFPAIRRQLFDKRWPLYEILASKFSLV